MSRPHPHRRLPERTGCRSAARGRCSDDVPDRRRERRGDRRPRAPSTAPTSQTAPARCSSRRSTAAPRFPRPTTRSPPTATGYTVFLTRRGADDPRAGRSSPGANLHRDHPDVSAGLAHGQRPGVERTPRAAQRSRSSPSGCGSPRDHPHQSEFSTTVANCQWATGEVGPARAERARSDAELWPVRRDPRGRDERRLGRRATPLICPEKRVSDDADADGASRSSAHRPTQRDETGDGDGHEGRQRRRKRPRQRDGVDRRVCTSTARPRRTERRRPLTIPVTSTTTTYTVSANDQGVTSGTTTFSASTGSPATIASAVTIS